MRSENLRRNKVGASIPADVVKGLEMRSDLGDCLSYVNDATRLDNLTGGIYWTNR